MKKKFLFLFGLICVKLIYSCGFSNEIIFNLNKNNSGWCLVIEDTDKMIEEDLPIVNLDSLNTGYYNFTTHKGEFKVQLSDGSVLEMNKIKLAYTSSMPDGRKILFFYVPNEIELSYDKSYWYREKGNLEPYDSAKEKLFDKVVQLKY